MKTKRPLQIFFLIVMLFSPVGGAPYAYAATNPSGHADAIVTTRELSIWDATYVGYVNASAYEKWQFALTEDTNFSITVTPAGGDLVALLILLDANGNELTRATGSLNSVQKAGNYFIQVQPQSGSSYYLLTLRKVAQQADPTVSVAVAPLSVSVGASAAVSVALSNVPAGGYTSAEFTCTYNGSLASAGNIVTGSLFGADAVAAINGPQNGSFIVAIAGSNGNKDTTSGNAFTFGLTGLQAGQTAITCTARVSNGDSQLVAIAFSPASLTITGNTPTPTRTVTSTAKPTATATATAAITATTTATIKAVTATPTITATTAVSPTATPTVTATRTSAPPVITSTATSTASPTPTATISGVGTLTGKVLAGKPVAVGLYRADKSLATSVPANADGTFSLSAPAGSYIAVAAAPGFLSAQGAVTLTGGSSASLPTVSLVAGDIDNNNVIDQFDAMTIGMNYNTATPATADLNKDGVINVLDLEILARNYRKTGPILWQ